MSSVPIKSERTWQMTLSNALIITRREVRDSLRDWRIIAPIVLLTFFFPFLAQSAATWMANFLAQYGADFIGGQFVPLMLMIVGFFPISISLVIALETFVGEKERLSLEPLLSTPLTNTELYIGKTLAAMIPPLIASFGGMTFYLILLYTSNSTWQPPVMIVVQMFILTIVQALVMVTGAVVVSSQATTTRSANLLASFIIIPMTLIINAEAITIFVAPDAQSPTGINALWLIAFGMVIITILLLRVGNSIFNREELLGRMIDSLNLIGFFKSIGHHMRTIDDEGNTASNIIDWYTRAIPYSFRKIRIPIMITTGVFIAYFLVGVWIGTLPQFQLGLSSQEVGFDALSVNGFNASTELVTIEFIITNNIQVILLGLVLSMFTFGVAAYIVMPTAFIILGYLASQMIPAGLTTLYIAAVLPHGIIEIPIVLIATAAMFHIGASVTKPPERQTVGYAWISALGSALKLMLGVVLPGLVIAAIVESTLTIQIVTQVLDSLS